MSVTVSTMAVTMSVFLLMAVSMTIRFLVGDSMPISDIIATGFVNLLLLSLCCLHWFDLPTPVAVTVTNISKEHQANLHQFNIYSPFNQAPTKLIASPSAPTMRISFASLISSISTNLLIASTKMEKQRATRKTALIKAPTTWNIQQLMFVDYLRPFWGNFVHQRGHLVSEF